MAQAVLHRHLVHCAMHEGPCADCAIRDLAVCSVLAPDEMARLRSVVSINEVAAGQTFLEEGEEATHLFNIVSGAVKLFKLLPDGRRQITGFLFPGDFLGIALNHNFAYSAEAMTPVRLCRFQRRRFSELLNEFPHLQRRLLEVAGNEIIAAQDQMLLLGRKTARERLASFLTMIARRSIAKTDALELAMGRTDIADYLGLTTETVSRTFTQMKKAGIIALPDPSHVRIIRREALDALCETA